MFNLKVVRITSLLGVTDCLILASNTALHRDIYYAKYYGKGGGMKWSAGEKKFKIVIREKNEEGERKKEENYTKKGGKGLKNGGGG